jgi:hypothetical protein
MHQSGQATNDAVADIHGYRHCIGMSAARRTLSAFSVAVGAAALTLGGCANAQQQVAGHRYNVPRANLIPKSDYPFFLPKSEEEGFIFILNPQARPRQQRRVLVQDREGVCRRANGGGYVSRTICGAQRVEWKDTDGEGRVTIRGGPTAQILPLA